MCMSTLITPDDIKAEVRAHYAARIQAGSCCGSNAACCSDDSVSTEVALYGNDTLASLPDDVVTTSFGCGNPIAIASLKPGAVSYTHLDVYKRQTKPEAIWLCAELPW